MKQLEQYISQFTSNLFPEFYQEEGPNFIAFVQAYYEWLEEHYQELILDSMTGFNVGDTLTQELDTGTVVTGEIISVDAVNSAILVYSTTAAPFRCKLRCNVLAPLVSSSGASTFIFESTSLNPTYHARKLLQYRDIDFTIDRFIVNFKEKYLKNIQFDTATNKVLLTKNALNVYRSKGTARGIDLFFKLVYGTKADIYNPGEDIIRPSDGYWFKPTYLEVSNTTRNVDYVGKVITGMSSNATAFVDKYIKTKSNGRWVHLLYLSNIRGIFEKDEALRSDRIYFDSPKVLGSLNEVEITNGGSNFNIGDVVLIEGPLGRGGKGIVSTTQTLNSGTVDLTFLDGGYGYTTNAVGFIAEKTLNVRIANTQGKQYFTLMDEVVQANTRGRIVGLYSNGILYVDNGTGPILSGQEIFQIDSSNTEFANATIDTASVIAGNGFVTLNSYSGVFSNSHSIRIRNSAITADFLFFTTTVGIANISSNGVFALANAATTTVSNTNFIVENVSSGDDAAFSINAIDNAEIGYFNSDLVLSNTSSYLNVALEAASYGLPKLTTANADSSVMSALTIIPLTIGSISSVSLTNPGQDYNVDPRVLPYQRFVAGSNLKDYTLHVANVTSAFTVGELVTQAFANISSTTVVVANTLVYTVGEKVFQGVDLATSTANGILRSSNSTALIITSVSGTFANTTIVKSTANVSVAQTSLSVTTANNIAVVAKGQIVSISVTSNDQADLNVKRLSLNNFDLGGNVIASSISGATGNITRISSDMSSLSIGLDGELISEITSSNGAISSLIVTDSGFGFAEGEELDINSEDYSKLAIGTARVNRQGVGSGFYKNTRGFLSANKYIQDGDYYQEYSYDVITRLSPERYKDMFMKIMHVAGTKMFSSTLIEETISVPVTLAQSNIVSSNT